jgi:hypothetical protein
MSDRLFGVLSRTQARKSGWYIYTTSAIPNEKNTYMFNKDGTVNVTTVLHEPLTESTSPVVLQIYQKSGVYDPLACCVPIDRYLGRDFSRKR